MLKVFESKLAEVNQAVLDKDANLKLIQQEFAVIKDFRVRSCRLLHWKKVIISLTCQIF